MRNSFQLFTAAVAMVVLGQVLHAQTVLPPLNGGQPSTQLNGGAPAAGLNGGPGNIGLSGGPGNVALSGGNGSVALSGGNGLVGAAMLPGPVLPFAARPTPLPGGVPAGSVGLTPLPGSTPGLSGRPGLTPSQPAVITVTPTP